MNSAQPDEIIVCLDGDDPACHHADPARLSAQQSAFSQIQGKRPFARLGQDIFA